MIKITEYELDKDLQEDFLKLMNTLYHNNPYSKIYINSIKKIINPSNPVFKNIKIKNFIACKENNVVGHISAIIDSRLSKEKIGIIGFYECIDENDISKELIKRAEDFLKLNECKKIHAPINFTIWHPYRFALEQGNETFLLEPITKDYYSKQFQEQGYSKAVEYTSAERSEFDTITKFTKKDYESLISQGFRIKTVNKDNYEESILSIFEMSKEIFKESWSYVEISKEEYLYIYEEFRNNLDNLLIQIIKNKEGKDIGFCSSIIDPNKKEIILKTMGVLPEYQNKRVGAALLYDQHKTAIEKGLKKEVYALIKLGNIVTKMPYPGISIIRKYITLKKELIEQ